MPLALGVQYFNFNYSLSISSTSNIFFLSSLLVPPYWFLPFPRKGGSSAQNDSVSNTEYHLNGVAV